jgi:hypothetical protein
MAEIHSLGAFQMNARRGLMTDGCVSASISRRSEPDNQPIQACITFFALFYFALLRTQEE